jgi:hypothetical protein
MKWWRIWRYQLIIWAVKLYVHPVFNYQTILITVSSPFTETFWFTVLANSNTALTFWNQAKLLTWLCELRRRFVGWHPKPCSCEGVPSPTRCHVRPTAPFLSDIRRFRYSMRSNDTCSDFDMDPFHHKILVLPSIDSLNVLNIRTYQDKDS